MDKAAFLETLHAERARWEALLAKADQARLSEPGVAGEWSLKDLIAHVTVYERGLVEWLEAALRGESVTFATLDHPDLDYRNAVIFAENRARPLPEVLRESAQVFQQLVKLIEGLPDNDLVDPHRTEWFVVPRWKASRPLWQCLADDSYRHYQQHVPDVRAWLERPPP